MRPSTVTCPSSMASRRADWVLGDERLISSAITICAKTAPNLNSNSRSTGLYTETPVTSPGSRSGVNWMRRTVASTLAAIARASIVLPTPGTSSMSRWPSASMHVRALRTASGLPSMTSPTDVRMAEVCVRNCSAVISGAVSSMRSLSPRHFCARESIVTRARGLRSCGFVVHDARPGSSLRRTPGRLSEALRVAASRPIPPGRKRSKGNRALLGARRVLSSLRALCRPTAHRSASPARIVV